MNAKSEKIQRNARKRQAEREQETKVPEVPAKLDGVTSEIVQVTPELAERWLKDNITNRRYNNTVALKYASDMTEGRWTYTGDPIQFDKDGFLQNGQHRLNAVVKSGKTIPFLIVRGLEPKAQAHMDLGRKRTLGDILYLEGYENPLILGAVVRGAASWMGGFDSDANRNQISDQECRDFLAENEKQIITAAFIAERYRSKIGLSAKLLGTFVFMGLVKGADESELDSFLSSIANYQTTGAGDPRSTLIARIQRAKNQREQMTTKYVLSILVRTWNGVQGQEEFYRFPSSYDKIPNMRIK